MEVAWSGHLEPLGLLPLAGAIWAGHTLYTDRRAAMAAGARNARGKDETVARRQTEVADVEKAAALASVPFPQIRLVPADLHPFGDVVVV